jgi:hypothetical protein
VKKESVTEKEKKKEGKNHGGVHELHPVTIRTCQVRAVVQRNFHD